ncbi:MAG TPA: thioredoxin family protein [Candidatus Sulfopaludibacter sp.]|nr:thioredoxin family protein [Candidatus Sulfopaludibacter sp.]
MSNWFRIGGALLVFLVCVLFIAKGFLPPADPKFVSAINYEQLQSVNQGPCIVYFYHKSTDTSVRKMMPALDELAARFQDKMGFYRYQFSNPEENVPQKTGYESTFTVYNGGKETKNYPVTVLSDKVADNEGLILLLIKDFLMTDHPDVPRQSGTPYVSAADFQPRVLEAARPVIVDFTSATCPPCLMLEPQFRQIAARNSKLADFYFFDNDSPANRALVRQYSSGATPTVICFFQGKPQGSFSGAFNVSDFNEGRILSLLQPYF